MFGICVVTISELLHGLYRTDSEERYIKREAFIENIMKKFSIYGFDLTAAKIYARIWSNLVKNEMAIGAHDLIIASTAISLGFTIITYEQRDYKKIKELNIGYQK